MGEALKDNSHLEELSMANVKATDKVCRVSKGHRLFMDLNSTMVEQLMTDDGFIIL